MVKTIIEAKRVPESIVKALIKAGILYTDANGLHCAKAGIYRKERK